MAIFRTENIRGNMPMLNKLHNFAFLCVKLLCWIINSPRQQQESGNMLRNIPFLVSHACVLSLKNERTNEFVKYCENIFLEAGEGIETSGLSRFHYTRRMRHAAGNTEEIQDNRSMLLHACQNSVDGWFLLQFPDTMKLLFWIGNHYVYY